VGLREAPAPSVWALLLAAWRTGVCVVGVHPRRSPDEQDVQLAEVGASLCMEGDGRLHALSGASLAEPIGSSFVAPHPLAASPPLAALERWLYEVGDRLSEPALILFTSGTTGRPKAARLSRRGVVASAVAHAVHSQGYTYAGWLLCMPAWHVGGWSVFLRAMIQGTRVVVSEPFEPRIVARRLREEAVGGVSFVPTMLHRLLEAGEAAPSSLRIALVGGAASPPGLLERARAAGWPVAPTWGLTECASQVATASPAAAGPTDGALLLPGFEIRARGESEEGELLVRGPQCFDGYLQPDGSIDRSAFDADGFFATGDLGRVLDRPHGRCVEVWNRRVDLIVSGGENVYPAEVERRLLALPGVREAAVVGLDDAEWGQVVAAVVVPDDPDATVAGLDALARATFPGFLRPKRWHLSASLPVGPTGKRDAAALRALFAATGG
jgi:O-succinylbenzoic acid--CoA ligase